MAAGPAAAQKSAGPAAALPGPPFSFAQLRSLRARIARSVRLAAVLVLVVLVASAVSELSAALPARMPGQHPFRMEWGIPYVFHDKKNVFNRVFVKLGWAWTTLAFAAAAAAGSRMLRLPDLLHLRAAGAPASTSGAAAAAGAPPALRRRSEWDAAVHDEMPRFARYAAATGYWYAMTQWCWGPPLLDRLFTATGGSCTVPGAAQNEYSMQCKRAGGLWEGGHDSSGHCFMLIHACLFLWEEIIAGGLFDVLLRSSAPSAAAAAAAAVAKKDADPQRRGAAELDGLGLGAKLWIYGGVLGRLSVVAVLTVFTLWTVMLVATAFHFHPLSEKLSGTVFGVLGWLVPYVIVYPSTTFPFLPLRE